MCFPAYETLASASGTITMKILLNVLYEAAEAARVLAEKAAHTMIFLSSRQGVVFLPFWSFSSNYV